MLATRLMRLKAVRPQVLAKRLMGGGGDHHHGPMMPPFARLKPPTSSLPEEVELVWDDSVAPETAIDFDAPHVSTGAVLGQFLFAASFVVGLYLLIDWSDPPSRSPVAPRTAVLSKNGFLWDLGLRDDYKDDEPENEGGDSEE